MVRTGSSTYVKYGWESLYGGSATIDKRFCIQKKPVVCLSLPFQSLKQVLLYYHFNLVERQFLVI